MNTAQTPHFLILGVARSGTTLLERLLDNHSQIAVCPESDVFNSLYRTCWRGYFVSDYHYRQFMTYLVGWLKEFNDPAVRVVQQYWEENATHHGPAKALLKALATRYLAQKQKEVFGEKTPNNVYYIKDISRLFPKGKLIRIIRHPFDVICSIKKLLESSQRVNHSSDELLLIAAFYVKKGIRAWNTRPFAAEQEYNLKYEDLIANPAAILAEICDFLGVIPEKNILAIEASSYLTNPGKKEVVHPNLGQPINAHNKNKYLKELSDSQQQLLFRYLGTKLASLPYDITDNKAKISGHQRLRLWKHQLIFQLKSRFGEEELIRLKLLVKSILARWKGYK